MSQLRKRYSQRIVTRIAKAAVGLETLKKNMKIKTFNMRTALRIFNSNIVSIHVKAGNQQRQ